MLPAFLLALREGLEAALTIGIVLGALRKLQRMDANGLVWLGALVAGMLSMGIAILLTRLGASLEGQSEAIFEGLTMFLAAGVLTWMIFWMQRQSRSLKSSLEKGVRQATLTGGATALFALSFVSVLREGIELALFLTAAVMTSGAQATLLGAFLGLLAAAGLGWALFKATVRLDLRRFFQVTSFLLILFAAGLVAHGVHEFNEVGLIPSLIDPVWNLGAWLAEDTTLGMLLTALFGYNSNPSLTEVLAYLGYFAAIAVGLHLHTNALPEAV